MNTKEQLKEMKKKLLAYAVATGMTLSSLPAVSAETSEDIQPSYTTMMSLANIKSSSSSKISSRAEFDKLVNNLVAEMKNKSVVSESGKPFTYAQTAPYVFMLNEHYCTDSLTKELINDGIISSEIEKTIVAAFSVEDGIKGHNFTMAVLNAKQKELDFGIMKFGKTKKQKVMKDGELSKINYLYAFNDTPFVKNRTSEKIMANYKGNIPKYWKDVNSYKATEMTVIEYLNQKDTKTGLTNLEKSIKIKALGKKEYKQSEMVDVTVAIKDSTEREIVAEAFDDFYNSTKDITEYNSMVKKYKKLYESDKLVTEYGVGTHWAVRPYTTAYSIITVENPYVTDFAYSNAKTNDEYKLYVKNVAILDEYSN